MRKGGLSATRGNPYRRRGATACVALAAATAVIAATEAGATTGRTDADRLRDDVEGVDRLRRRDPHGS